MSRQAHHDIEPMFLNRWSPRAMSGAPVSIEVLQQLLEAARWAPSSSNLQPWHFLYSRTGSDSWQTFVDLMVPFNQSWATKAGVLLVVTSTNVTPKGAPAPTHAFDAGAAWMSLALQGSALGLVVHGMGGFDYVAARERLAIPDTETVLAMVAIGHPGDKEALPAALQAREFPSDRKPQSEWTFEGRWPNSQ